MTIPLQYVRDWGLLSYANRRAIADFFEHEHRGTWEWRTFIPNGNDGHDMQIKFTDPETAMLFKLTWGGR